MKTNIILAGVGGQGILTIAAVLDTAALASDLNLKQSEVHGMSQRGERCNLMFAFRIPKSIPI